MRAKRVLRIAVFVIGAVIAAFCAYAWGIVLTAESRLKAAVAQFEREVGPLDLARYVLAPVSDDDNAAIPLRRAMDSLPRNDAGRVDWKRLDGLAACATGGAGSLDSDALRRTRATLAANNAILDELALATERRASSWGVRYDDLNHELVPYLGEWRYLMDLAQCDANVALRDGHVDRGVLRLESLLRMGTSLRAEPDFSRHGQGAIWEGRAFRLFAVLLQRPDVDLDRLQRAIPSDDAYANWRTAFVADAANAYAWHHRLSEDSDSDSDSERLWHAVFTAATLSRRLEFVLAADRSRSEASAAAPAPWYSLPVMKPFQEMTLQGAELDVALFLETSRSLARRSLALVREARSRGAYPPTLDPPSTAADDPVGELPLAYVVQSDGSAVLSAPGAADVLRGRSRYKPSDFEWRLPPVTEAPQ